MKTVNEHQCTISSWKVRRFAVLVGLYFTAAHAGAIEVSQFFYTGNGYVAAGKTQTISSEDSFRFFAYDQFSLNTISFAISNDFRLASQYQYFYLTFSAPQGQRLAIGDYINAMRAPFQAAERPGLSFSANSRGDNQLTGSFKILDIDYAGEQAIDSLAVDFVQNDENGYLGQTYGSLRYQSAIPITLTIPEPTVVMQLAFGLALLFYVRRRRS